jgi:hypothetical protein
MATDRRPWPKAAEWARSDSIALVEQIRDELQPILENEQMTYHEIVRRVALSVVKAMETENLLRSIRPDR